MSTSRFLVVSALLGISQALSISVSATGGNASSPYQYGIMFEDINHSGDGGIYAELIQNRAFQGSASEATLEPWNITDGASAILDQSSPLSWALPNSVQVTGLGESSPIQLANPGWWGIDVKGGQVYNGSFYSRGAYGGVFTAKFVDLDQNVLASASIQSDSTADGWTQHTFQLLPVTDAPSINNSFVLELAPDAKATVNLNLISVFPPTYNDRPNGMRIELMQMLKDLSPSYFRIPGGNNLEGQAAPDYWNWTATIGPLTERPGREGDWGYYNTDGLGLIEYMLWCQDLDVEPLLAVWDGLYLGGEMLSASDLEWYVNDTLNELDFLMGDGSTEWSAKRVALGYPEPFDIKFVEVGNEDNVVSGGLASYESYRFSMYYDAISAKYPGIIVVASTSDIWPKTEGAAQDFHEYSRPDNFVAQFNNFDHYNASNPTFIGEYAIVQNNTGDDTEGVNWSLAKVPWTFWEGSVSEAIFLLGAERNSDRIIGASYAPMLQNLNSYEWTPNLIPFTADPSETITSTSYHVVKLLSGTRFTHTLPSTADEGFGPVYWSAGINNGTGSRVFKAAVYNATAAQDINLTFEGVGAGSTAQLTVLTADGPLAQSVPNGGDPVVSTASELVAGSEGAFQFSLPALSIAVLHTL